MFQYKMFIFRKKTLYLHLTLELYNSTVKKVTFSSYPGDAHSSFPHHAACPYYHGYIFELLIALVPFLLSFPALQEHL